MAIKHVLVPLPVVLLSSNGERLVTLKASSTEKDENGKPRQISEPINPISMYDYLINYIFNEPEIDPATKNPKGLKIGIGFDGNERMHTLGAAFKGAIPGTVIPVDGADHAIVSKIIRETNWTNGWVAQQLYPLERSWIKAEDKPPLLTTVPMMQSPVNGAVSESDTL